MPILYVHGVNVRDHAGFEAAKPYLRRLVAPVISKDSSTVLIDEVYWGDLGVRFACGGISRPTSLLLGMGAVTGQGPLDRVLAAEAFKGAFRDVPRDLGSAPSTGGLISGGGLTSATGAGVRIKDLSDDDLSDLLAEMMQGQSGDPDHRARLALAADQVARDTTVRAALLAASTPKKELDILTEHIERIMATNGGFVAMGVFTDLKDRLSEVLNRADDFPAYAASVIAAEIRPKLNDLVSVFIGDVFTYLSARGQGSGPGPIPGRLLEKLRAARESSAERGGEPIIVLSHSMGGQIVYDAVTHFLPESAASQGARIDFWCATASQVGFFEEAKLFLASRSEYGTGRPVPFPKDHVGVWWNVWDHNDFLSFRAAGIIDGLWDESFDSGLSLLAAHGGYLQRPSFYRRFARRLTEAAKQGWSIK